MQALAPSASARKMSCPVRTPESSRISFCPPIASATFGSAEMVEGAPSSWRPPWFDTTTPSAPVFSASRASSGSRMPFSTSLPVQIERIHSTSFQLTVGSNWLLRPFGERDAAEAGQVAVDIGEGPALAVEDAPRPARPHQHVEHGARRDARRHRAGRCAGRQWRCPFTGRSTVRNSAEHFAAAARSISAFTKPRSRIT